MKLHFTPRARRDLDKIAEYLLARSPSGARNVLTAIDRSLGLLVDFPESGELSDHPNLRVRVVPGYPYKIYYRVFANRIDVAHIRHTSREEWKGP